jgi:hypothetical protein
MIRVLASLALSLCAGACASGQSHFTAAAEAAGMTDIALGEVVFNGCGNENGLARKFTARNRDGDEVAGLICGSLLGPKIFAVGPTPAALAQRDAEPVLASRPSTPALAP